MRAVLSVVARVFAGAVVLCILGEAVLPGLPSGPQTRPSLRDRSRPASPRRDPADVVWPSLFFTAHVGGFTLPVNICGAGDGSGRLFVTELAGRIRIVRQGALEARPFLDIRARVRSGGEQGLLSVAFPPGYPGRAYVYVNYTRSLDGATVVSRFRLTADPSLADAGSEEILLVVPQPYANHNGGHLTFGPADGFLYIGLGDGGSGGDPQNNAQNPASLLGKILRLDTESGAAPYGIPPSNPFVTRPGFRPEIWALGLRNPWRFSFDRETGDLYIADVGQGIWEEIDFQPAASRGGENYGWRLYEGAHDYLPPASGNPPEGYSPPIAEYDHSQGCSVTGGYVCRSAAFPGLRGIYLYGDYCSGRIWGLARDNGRWVTRVLAETGFAISTFGEDDDGNPYFADLGSGMIYRLSAERPKKGTIKK